MNTRHNIYLDVYRSFQYMGHVGQSTRSQGQILEKPSEFSRRNQFSLIMKLLFVITKYFWCQKRLQVRLEKSFVNNIDDKTSSNVQWNWSMHFVYLKLLYRYRSCVVNFTKKIESFKIHFQTKHCKYNNLFLPVSSRPIFLYISSVSVLDFFVYLLCTITLCHF